MKKVLIVDDSAFMRVTIRSILEKSGYAVVAEAENGWLGVNRYFELKPDIVTMDITMPEMDGITSLKEIMRLNSKANVIMLTAVGQQHVVRDAIVSGARGFVVKPFKEETFLSALAKI